MAALLLASVWTSDAFLAPGTLQRRASAVAAVRRAPRVALAAASDGGSSAAPPPLMPTARDEGFMLEGPLAEKKDRFVVDITAAEPTAAELAEGNLVKIVKQKCTDEEVNMLAWKCLGACLPAWGCVPAYVRAWDCGGVDH